MAVAMVVIQTATPGQVGRYLEQMLHALVPVWIQLSLAFYTKFFYTTSYITTVKTK
jgi:hypothetical protein